MNMAEFFHMGGHAFYVWGSYGVTLVVLTLHVMLARRQQRKALHAILRGAQRSRSRA